MIRLLYPKFWQASAPWEKSLIFVNPLEFEAKATLTTKTSKIKSAQTVIQIYTWTAGIDLDRETALSFRFSAETFESDFGIVGL